MILEFDGVEVTDGVRIVDQRKRLLLRHDPYYGHSGRARQRLAYNAEGDKDHLVHDRPAILRAILNGYALPFRGEHGVVHWARVLENGMRLAEATGADAKVVALFALFHDSRRVNEGHDPGHGLRGARFAQTLRGSLVHLDDAQFELLFEACRLHTSGLIEGDVTLQACWDADRLDLGRVGITPRPHRLCSDAAQDLLPWAHGRAVTEFEPAEHFTARGVGDGGTGAA